MNINQKGFANIILVVVIVTLVGAVGYLALVKKPATLPTDQLHGNGLVFQQKSGSIVGVTFPLRGDYFITEVFEFQTGHYSNNNKLMVVNAKNNASALLNLSGFKGDRGSYDVDIYSAKRQQIFSPAGDKIILPVKEPASYQAYNHSVLSDLAIFDLKTNNPGKVITNDWFKYKIPTSSNEFYYGWVSDHEIMYTCLPITGTLLEEEVPHYCYYNLDTGKTELKEKIDKLITYDTIYASDRRSQPPAFSSKLDECILISANLGCLSIVNGEILHQKNDSETSLYIYINKGDFNDFFGWSRGNDVYVVINQFLGKLASAEIRKFSLGDGQPTPTLTPKPTPKSSSTPVPTTPKTGDIEEIQTLLNKDAWVRVIVMLKGNEFAVPEFRDDVKKKSEVKKIQDAVLVTLTENDFQISHQYQFITSFAGMVSKSGMEKLLKNSQVISISIDRLNAPN